MRGRVGEGERGDGGVDLDDLRKLARRNVGP